MKTYWNSERTFQLTYPFNIRINQIVRDNFVYQHRDKIKYIYKVLTQKPTEIN